MINRGEFRIHVAQRRLLEDLVLRMVQRPASGTFDLELCKPTRTGEKSSAVTASEFFQHLQIPFAESPFPWAIKNPALWTGFVESLQTQIRAANSELATSPAPTLLLVSRNAVSILAI
jgi:hypothetical protein